MRIILTKKLKCMGDLLCKMHCRSPHMALWIDCSQCHLFSIFFFYLALIGPNYKPICWGIVRLKYGNQSRKKNK